MARCVPSQYLWQNQNTQGKVPTNCNTNIDTKCTITCQDIVRGGITYNTRTQDELTYNMKCTQISEQPAIPIGAISSPIFEGSRPRIYWKLTEPTGSNRGHYANLDFTNPNNSNKNARLISTSKGCYYTCEGRNIDDETKQINCRNNGIPAYPGENATNCSRNECKPGYIEDGGPATGKCVLNGRNATYDVVECVPDRTKRRKTECASYIKDGGTIVD